MNLFSTWLRLYIRPTSFCMPSLSVYRTPSLFLCSKLVQLIRDLFSRQGNLLQFLLHCRMFPFLRLFVLFTTQHQSVLSRIFPCYNNINLNEPVINKILWFRNQLSLNQHFKGKSLMIGQIFHVTRQKNDQFTLQRHNKYCYDGHYNKDKTYPVFHLI